MVRNSSRIRNRFHRDGELRSGPGVGRRLADGTSCSWLNLDLASSRCRVPSSLMIWRARILVGSGAGVVLYRTGLAMDQSRAAAVRGGLRAVFLVWEVWVSQGLGFWTVLEV